MTEAGRNYYPGPGPSYPQQAMIPRGSGSREENPWAELLSQFQTMITENEKMQQIIRRNTEEIETRTNNFQKTLREKEDELQHANKQYWDVRVSVLGFKARIMKLNGELEAARKEKNAEAGSESPQTSQQGVEQLRWNLDQIKREKEALEYKQRQTSSQMGAMEQKKNSLQAAVDQLSGQVRDLQSLLQQKSEECRMLDNRMREQAIRCQTAIKEKQEVERQLQEQSKRPTPRPRTNIVQQRELELQRQNDLLQGQYQALQGQKDELMARFRTAQQQLREAEEQRRIARESTAASVQMESHISELQRQNEILQGQKEDLMAQFRTAQHQLHEAEARTSTASSSLMESRISELQRELAKSKSSLGGAEEQLARARSQTKQEKAKKEELIQKISDLHKTIDSKNTEMAQLKATVDSNSKEMTKLKAKLNNQAQPSPAEAPPGGKNTAMSKKIADARRRILELERENERIVELERKSSELQRSLRETEQIADEKSIRLEEVQSSEEEAKRQLDELREERDQLNKELTIKHEAVDDFEDQLYQLKQEKKSIQNDMRFVQDELQNCKEKLHTAEVEQSRLQSKLMKQDQMKKKEESDWDNFINEQTQGVQRMNEQLEKQRLEINRLQQEVRRLESDKGRLDQKLEAKHKECVELLETSKLWKVQVDVVRNDYLEERRAREKMAQELNLFQQAKQRSDQEVANLKDQVTTQRSQIAVLKDLVDHDAVLDTGLDASDYSEPRHDPLLGGAAPMGGGNPVGGGAHMGGRTPVAGRTPMDGGTPMGGGAQVGGGMPMGGVTPQGSEGVWSPQGAAFGGNQFSSPDLPHSQSRTFGTTPNPRPPVVNIGHDFSAGVGDFGRAPAVPGMGTEAGRVGGAFTEFHRPATSVPQPYQQQHMEVYDTRVPMPGEVKNLNRPTMACPICLRSDFVTQTELEVHSAKCLDFGPSS